MASLTVNLIIRPIFVVHCVSFLLTKSCTVNLCDSLLVGEGTLLTVTAKKVQFSFLRLLDLGLSWHHLSLLVGALGN